jgi:hypothetical protein
MRSASPNGWRQTGVDDDISAAGDEALSGATARYENCNGRWRGETTLYVERVETTNLPEVRVAYVVGCVDHTFRVDFHGDALDDEFDYSGGSPLYYDSEADALAVAETIARRDDSATYLVGLEYVVVDLTANNAHCYPDRETPPDFGYGVCRQGHGLQEFGDGYMTEGVATARAAALNAGESATDITNEGGQT